MAKSPLGRPWAANGSILHTCWIHFGSHFSSYFQYFSEPLKTWNLQYLTAFLKVLAIPKALILGPFFDHFFDPILGPPLEEPFGPPWPPKVPTLPPHVDSGPFFGTPPGIHNGTLERPGAPRKCQKSQLPESRIASRDRHGSDPCPKGVPQAILIDVGTSLGGKAAFWGAHG